MLSGVTCSAGERAGRAVFRIFVSSDSIKNATATSHGRRRLVEAAGWGVSEGAPGELMEAICVWEPLYATRASKTLPGTRVGCATLLQAGTFPSLFIGGFSVIVYCTRYC